MALALAIIVSSLYLRWASLPVADALDCVGRSVRRGAVVSMYGGFKTVLDLAAALVR